MVLALVVGCGSKRKTMSDHNAFEWPNNELANMLPKPESNFGKIRTNKEDEFSVEIGHTSSKQYEEYISKCREYGFSIEDYSSSTMYRADNSAGYKLELLYSSSYEYMTITLEIPINSREYQWPRSEIASLLPVPKSNMGRVEWEADYGFVLYVGNTTKADYDEYVNACADRGFTVDYRKGDDYYYANNENGYKLTLPVSKGAACPKCKSANTQTMGESKVFTVWKIIVGVFLIVAGFGSMSPGFSPSWVLIIGGAALAANGTPFLSKKKVDCVCMDCRKRFRF